MKQKTPRLRQCDLTRKVKKVDDLIRFVLSPDNVITPDIDAKAEGRGVWVSLSYLSIEQSVKKNIFSKALSCQVNVPKDLAQLTQTRLEQRLLGALGLARKAGQLIIGGAKTRSLIESGNIVALISASDAANDERAKILNLAARKLEKNSYLHIDILHSDQLNLALGRENVIYGALIDGVASKTVVKRANRLIQYVNTNIK